MKIIFDFQDMIGGAPRSQLAHMLQMKKNGHEVVAVIGKDKEKLESLAPNVRIVCIENFHTKSFKSLIKSSLSWKKLIKQENPDIIHSNRTTQSKFLAVLSDFYKVPHVFAQAGGIANKYDIKSLEGKIGVLYSLENLHSFKSSNFDEKALFVIANRISMLDVKEAQRGDKIKMLMVGNIKEGTINGYVKFIESLKNISSVTQELDIEIAGIDFSKEKSFIKRLKKSIDAINNDTSLPVKVTHLGWVDNITSTISDAEICIGKGRSILQPAMTGRVCYVLSEDGVLTRIDKKNFDSLYEYNFSGRGEQSSSNKEFFDMLASREMFESIKIDSSEVVETVKKEYLEDFAYEKLLKAYNYAVESQKFNCLNGLKRFSKILLYFIIKSKL